jgi:hypothetical protein
MIWSSAGNPHPAHTVVFTEVLSLYYRKHGYVRVRLIPTDILT